ncbi:hypothetical protein niasHS_001816 [Heterodera schachtii]|uniref:Uncharacterized protein n=1 Tax=Heterodera schachtii TaxID=97005 RepID=A0ABD2KAD4_HETSC
MALLCAAEPDCIVPIGQTEQCIYTKMGPNLKCHRQRQSLLDTLLHNLEQQQQIADPSFLAHPNVNHPRLSAKFTDSFGIKRLQLFAGSSDEWLRKVKCC